MTDSRIVRRYVSGLFFLAAMVFCACTQVPEYCAEGDGPFDFTNYRCVGGKAYLKTSDKPTPDKYTLTVTKNLDGGGTTTPASSQTGITAGTSVNLSTTVNSGYTFNNWTVTAGSGTITNATSATNASVLVKGNVTVTANFTQNSTGGGESYDYVEIGGKKWMKNNLNIETADSWCYKDNPDSCAKYGRLYTWYAAKTACDSIGWKLPTSQEWSDLVEAAGVDAGRPLKSKSGWITDTYNGKGNGSDIFGFSALPSGYRHTDGSFDNVGKIGSWWTATEYSSATAYLRYIRNNFDDVPESNGDKGFGYSVRCVKED